MNQLLVVVAFACLCSAYGKKLEEKYAWKEMDFSWPSNEMKQEFIKTGQYIEENNLPLGLDIWKNKIFVTVPRWKAGVAASLNYLTISDEKSPVLTPYPSWEANTLKEVSNETDDRIVSTFRIRIDECDRLWVMDTGLADIFGKPMQLAPPAIVIFDLKTDKLIKRYIIPEDHIKEDTFFANIIVDTQKGKCDDAHAYVPDLGAYSVVVFSLKKNQSWRLKHNFFHFDPLQGDYNVGGVNFQWTDGVFGMALGKPINDEGDRTVYFHALSSTKEFAVSNTVFKNESYSTSPDSYYAYKLLGDRGMKSQATAEFFDDNTDVIFYTQVNKDAIGCWNVKKNFVVDNQGLVDSDSDALVFPNDLKIDENGNLWVLSDRMPVFLFGELKKEFNYRILKGNTKDLIKGTPCDN